MNDVIREIDLDAYPAEVWEAVTSPDQLAEWFAADVEGEVVPGEVLRFTAPDGTERRALVERVDEPRELIFRWLPGSTDEEPPSRVDITINETEDGSVLRVVERRIEAAVTPVQQIGFKALARI